MERDFAEVLQSVTTLEELGQGGAEVGNSSRD